MLHSCTRLTLNVKPSGSQFINPLWIHNSPLLHSMLVWCLSGRFVFIPVSTCIKVWNSFDNFKQNTLTIICSDANLKHSLRNCFQKCHFFSLYKYNLFHLVEYASEVTMVNVRCWKCRNYSKLWLQVDFIYFLVCRQNCHQNFNLTHCGTACWAGILK